MNSPFVKTPKSSFIIICLFLNCITQTEPDEPTTFDTKGKYPASISSIDLCPSNVECSKLGNPCINCSFNHSCVYGSQLNVSCTVKDRVNCSGSTTFVRVMRCQYCYQTESWEHTCTSSSLCKAVASPRQYYTANCSVKSEIICLGKRRFLKRLPCNWTGGYRWRTALFLSVVLGGFGADRFYLGHWQEGIGKLFSFGGLGVWTLIDVILISLHYLGPADGSLYI